MCHRVHFALLRLILPITNKSVCDSRCCVSRRLPVYLCALAALVYVCENTTGMEPPGWRVLLRCALLPWLIQAHALVRYYPGESKVTRWCARFYLYSSYCCGYRGLGVCD